MDLKDRIAESRHQPHTLEKLYREEPDAFFLAFPGVFEQHQESEVLAVWKERLYYQEAETNLREPVPVTSFRKQDPIWVAGMLAVLAGITTRGLLFLVEEQTIAPANLVFGVLPFLAVMFLYRSRPDRHVTIALILCFLIPAIYLNVLPLEERDSILLSYLHLPFFLWVVVGLAFTGNTYRESSARLAYLKFNGEFAILYAILALSGGLLTALTMALFQFVGLEIEEFYFSNVVLPGAAFLFLVTSWLVTGKLKLSQALAPLIARIFSPLVLVTLLAYLITVVLVGKNPFLDRGFLLVFNGILLCVLAITIFSITELHGEQKKNLSACINTALIALALIIDSIAFAAIAFRLSSYGITPNRLAVMGVNLIIWINLASVLLASVRFLWGKKRVTDIQKAVTEYLPIYGLWAAFVTFAFPILFR